MKMRIRFLAISTLRGARQVLRVALALALSVATFAVACQRERPAKQLPEASPNATTRASVSFPTADGGLIYADEYGDGNHGVVLAHGARFKKESWTTQARALAQVGFRVLAIDFRGYGKSKGGNQSDDGYHLDVLAAVRYLRDSGSETVSVVGASFGGWAAARASVEAGGNELDRLILLAASPIEHPERMKGRKLFITARDDFIGNGVPRLPQIREQFEKASEPKELVILDGAAHAQYIFETEQGERLMQEILRFLSAP